MQTVNFYARDFFWLFLVAMASFTAKTTMNLHHETFNLLMFGFAWCIWGMEFFILMYNEHKNWTDIVHNYHRHPFSNSLYLILWTSFLIAPFFNLFNSILTDMEGVWDAVLLNLSMQPIRYFWDNVRSMDKSIIKDLHDDNKYRDHAA